MSFIETTKLIGKAVTLRTWQLYFFDIFMICMLFGAASSVKDLSLFSQGLRQITIYSGDITILGGLGIYSFRIATYVAIFRHCRTPQVLEWWIFLVGFGLTAVLFLFGGSMLKPYAEMHGYKFCYRDSQRRSIDVFVQQAIDCPSWRNP